VENCISFFNDPRMGGVIGKQEVWNEKESVWTQCKAAERRAAFAQYKPFSVWMYQRKALEQTGGFDEKLGFGEDVDLGKRLVNAGYKLAFAEKAVWRHREPKTLMALLKRQWRFGLHMKAFYQKNGWPKIMIGDLLFFLSLPAGLVAEQAWVYSVLFLGAKIFLHAKTFAFSNPFLWPFLAVFLVSASLAFKLGRLAGGVQYYLGN
jgi:GT2 family glycosyltransferase